MEKIAKKVINNIGESKIHKNKKGHFSIIKEALP
jgi:hypothetical protein